MPPARLATPLLPMDSGPGVGAAPSLAALPNTPPPRPHPLSALFSFLVLINT